MNIIPSQTKIENSIILMRGEQVIMDADLAHFYGIDVKRLNEQVKRNSNRFPEDFCFQLSEEEFQSLRSQNATIESGRGKHRKYLPYVFTEEGVAAVSAVIKNEKAADVSIQIMRAFVKMRRFFVHNADFFERLKRVEIKQLDADQKINQIFKALENKKPQPDKGIFFDGQIFDAYIFLSDLIKSAEREIILIDNYVNEVTLSLLDKRREKVTVAIFTNKISDSLKLDIEKHNSQYPTIDVRTLKDCHDRFLIIDKKELYHIGASLKDLGKKWFAFSRMDSLMNEILKRLD